MATSRRNFLKTGSMSLLFLGVPAAALARVSVRSIATGFPAGNGKRPINFTRETFAPHLNTVFRIRTSGAALDAKLTKITDLKAISKNPARIAGKESFSLLFVTSKKAPVLTQSTYIIEHRALGRFSLFMVPVGQAKSKNLEAIICQL
jgi:hypothetical protein